MMIKKSIQTVLLPACLATAVAIATVGATPAAARSRISVLALGDSLTVGRGSYAGQLKAYFPTKIIAKSGQQTGWMLDQLRQVDLQPYTHLVVLGGGNDINNGRILTAWRNLYQIYSLARQARLKVIAVTLSPWKGWPSWTQRKHQETDRLNQWIRSLKGFGVVDQVVDFQRLTADPRDRERLHPAFDRGTDHLHPNWLAHRYLMAWVYRAVTAGE